MEKIVRYLFFGAVMLALVTLALYCQRQNLLSSKEKESSVHHMILEKTEQLGRLEVVKYRIKDVVEQKIERSWYAGGDTKVLVIVSGEAVGCVDLQQLKKEDIVFEENRVTIQLPQPQICYAKVNHNESKVYDAPTSPFSNNANAVDAAFRNAENQIHAAALEMGIIDESKENAKKVLQPLFSAFTDREIVITFKGDPENKAAKIKVTPKQ
ncbi:MAG: DUF4230 domain-containing protein [Bacteroidia bacterium]